MVKFIMFILKYSADLYNINYKYIYLVNNNILIDWIIFIYIDIDIYFVYNI